MNTQKKKKKHRPSTIFSAIKKPINNKENELIKRILKKIF